MLNSRSKPKPKPGNRQEPFLCALLFVSDTYLSKDKPSKNKDVTYCPWPVHKNRPETRDTQNNDPKHQSPRTAACVSLPSIHNVKEQTQVRKPHHPARTLLGPSSPNQRFGTGPPKCGPQFVIIRNHPRKHNTSESEESVCAVGARWAK